MTDVLTSRPRIRLTPEEAWTTRSRDATQALFLVFEPDERILSWDNQRLGV